MVRLLVTADWQIGMQADYVASAAQQVRQARLEAAKKVVRLANDFEVDALVLAGDTFEDNQVSPALSQKVLEILRQSEVPVFVLPGNHDPWGPDSIWKKIRPNLPTHVQVLTTPDPVSLGGNGVVLCPCPVASKNSRHDPTEVIPPRQPTQTLRIAVAHGSLKIEGKYQEDDFPIELDAASRRDVDLLLVGHWHSLLQYPTAESVNVLYPGTHEQTKFDEHDAGQACLVHVEAPGAGVEVKILPTGILRWEILDAPIFGVQDVERLEDSLRRLEQPQRTLVSIELGGVAPLAAHERLRRLREEVVPALELLHVRFRGDVQQDPSDEEIEQLITTPVLGQVVSRLKRELEQGVEQARVARQALRILWSIQNDGA